jgi:hypothetical protein
MAARDIIVIMVVLFALGLGFFIMHFALNTTIDRMLSTPQINESNSTVTALQGSKTVTNRLDYVLFGVFIGLTLGLIITGYLIGSNPIFMFIYFLVVGIVVAISPILSNTWETVSTMSIFGVTLSYFPITNHIMLYLPIYMTIIGFIGFLAMFAKPFISKVN